MTEEQKPEKKSSYYIKHRKDGSQFVVLIVGDFPLTKFYSWEKDCKINFSGCRWAKMMSDHDKANSFDLLVQNKFEIQQSVEEETPQEQTLMGGEKLKGD